MLQTFLYLYTCAPAITIQQEITVQYKMKQIIRLGIEFEATKGGEVRQMRTS